MSATHPVWPGGPPCRPTCPGPSSTWHQGYADGYEAGAKDPMAGLADAVEAVKGKGRDRARPLAIERLEEQADALERGATGEPS